MTLALFCVAAALGACARYLLDRAVQASHDTDLPWGTVVVNVVGSAVLGVVLGIAATLGLPDGFALVIGAGFCGAFTTYSTFAYETWRLVQTGRPYWAAAHLLVSVTAGAIALLVGTLVGSWIGER